MVNGVGNGVEQVRGMKVRSSVKKLCEGCKVCLGYSSLWQDRALGSNWRDLKVVWGGRKEWAGMRHVVEDGPRPGRERRILNWSCN
jgi:hypothetical protein